jgi:hypothetical protein
MTMTQTAKNRSGRMRMKNKKDTLCTGRIVDVFVDPKRKQRNTSYQIVDDNHNITTFNLNNSSWHLVFEHAFRGTAMLSGKCQQQATRTSLSRYIMLEPDTHMVSLLEHTLLIEELIINSPLPFVL